MYEADRVLPTQYQGIIAPRSAAISYGYDIALEINLGS